jgi:hypothetical protein
MGETVPITTSPDAAGAAQALTARAPTNTTANRTTNNFLKFQTSFFYPRTQ